MRLVGRKFWLLAALLVLSGIMAAAQTRCLVSAKPTPTQRLGITLLRPFEIAIHAGNQLWTSLTGSFQDRFRLAQENSRLQQEVSLLSLRNDHLLHLAEENDHLRELLKMRQHDPSAIRWVPAEVVEREPSEWFHLVTLNQGSSAGIRKHSVVITAEGLVGQVVMVRQDSCDALLLTDTSANAGAFVPRTHDVGYVQGTGHEELILSFFSPDHGVKVGDIVVSSPFSALYPSGLLLGHVSEIVRDNRTGTRTAIVRPAVSFNKLETAFLIP